MTATEYKFPRLIQSSMLQDLAPLDNHLNSADSRAICTVQTQAFRLSVTGMRNSSSESSESSSRGLLLVKLETDDGGAAIETVEANCLSTRIRPLR